MSERFAAFVIRARFAIIAGWIAAAVAATLLLPSLQEAQSGSLGDLVPAGAKAIDAEERSAELFAFPVSSRTLVVQRNPEGLGGETLATTARRVFEVNTNRLPDLRDAAGAYGLTNAVSLPFARERGTTAISYLLFAPDSVGPTGRTRRAENYIKALDVDPGQYAGVTGAVPARVAQFEIIRERLPLVELATVLMVLLAVGVYLRSLVAPFVNLLSVAVAYLVAVRVVAAAGSAVDVSVPSEVEPVVVALLLGVVTDYAIFYMSRFRRRLAEGAEPRQAASRTTADVTPIVLACGLAVALGSAALVVADLGFLKAFGPGMAMSVLVALAVVLTLVPATIAVVGRGLFWPSAPAQSTRRLAGRSRMRGAIARSVRAPKRTLLVTLVLLGAAAAPLAQLDLGNPLLSGLPADAEPRRAYVQLTEGFAPGVVAPTTLIVEAPGITGRDEDLASLQAVLSNQPGIAGVLGPATTPNERALGVTLSRTGDAARFVLIPGTDPLGATAVRRLENLSARMSQLLDVTGLQGARASFAGDTALVAETMEYAASDLWVVIPAVLVAVALVLVVFLRAILVPAALVLLAALAPCAALGLAVLFFQGALGYGELTYYVPIVAGVLLLALGSDYNIFLAGRIWDDARELPLREAIVSAGSGAAHAITAAGIILAASFGALALVPIAAFRELAFVLAAGLLIDAFVVRTVMAPAVIALIGRRRRSGLDQPAPDRVPRERDAVA